MKASLNGCDTISNVSESSDLDLQDSMSLSDIDRITNYSSDINDESFSDENISLSRMSNVSMASIQSDFNIIPMIVQLINILNW